MNAILEKIEVVVVGIGLAAAGVVGSIWMLKALDSSLMACAASSPCLPF